MVGEDRPISAPDRRPSPFLSSVRSAAAALSISAPESYPSWLPSNTASSESATGVIRSDTCMIGCNQAERHGWHYDASGAALPASLNAPTGNTQMQFAPRLLGELLTQFLGRKSGVPIL